MFYVGFSMRRRDHPVFYHSNCSSDLERSSKMSLKLALGPKTAQEGPRTPSIPHPGYTFGAQVTQKGSRFEAQNQRKNNVGFRSRKPRPHGRPKARQRDLGTSKVKEFLRRGCQFQLFTLINRKTLLDRFWSSKRLVLRAFLD